MAKVHNELTNGQLWLYRLVVRFMLRTHNSGRIKNDSDCHAAILISELINSAREKVAVYCKCLANEVWGAEVVIDAIESAIGRGIKFHVAVQDKKEDCEKSRAYRLFRDKSVFVKHCETALGNGAQPIRANFLIVDGKSFRFEPNPSEYKGFAYACNNEMAKKLNDAFYEKIWKAKP